VANLVIIGGIALDYLLKVKDVDSRYTQVLEYSENLGGMAYNTATACAQLGVKTRLVSAVGSDFPKIKSRKNLALDLTKGKKPSTRCFLFYDGKGERICFYRGPYHDIDVEKAKKAVRSADWVHFAGIAPRFAQIVKEAVKSGKTISFNPGYDLFHYNPKDKLIKSLVDASDYLILSFNEAKYLGVKKSDSEGRVIIITRGRQGSEVYASSAVIMVPAYRVKTKSPFGAGDTYTGTLIAALMKGHGLVESAKLASAAASFAVEEKATTPRLSWARIVNRESKLAK